jgi:hypothetical protein|tara:strand:- start:775 stop:939 length:165 start_codon:yes stop_codon:yes gene_type:complete
MDYIVILCSFLIGVFCGGFYMTRQAEIVIHAITDKLKDREEEFKTYLKELGNNS